jgi:hypothetical protein
VQFPPVAGSSPFLYCAALRTGTVDSRRLHYSRELRCNSLPWLGHRRSCTALHFIQKQSIPGASTIVGNCGAIPSRGWVIAATVLRPFGARTVAGDSRRLHYVRELLCNSLPWLGHRASLHCGCAFVQVGSIPGVSTLLGDSLRNSLPRLGHRRSCTALRFAQERAIPGVSTLLGNCFAIPFRGWVIAVTVLAPERGSYSDGRFTASRGLRERDLGLAKRVIGALTS